MFFGTSQEIYDLTCRETAMRNIENNLLRISSNDGINEYYGTGYFSDTIGHIITAGHVIENNKWDVCVKTRNGNPININHAINYHYPLQDIAILKSDTVRPEITCIKTEEPTIDDSVTILGYNQPGILQKILGTVTYLNFDFHLDGTKEYILNTKNVFEINKPCYPGMSGGVIIRNNQEILGIIIGSNKENTYAIKITDVLQYILS